MNEITLSNNSMLTRYLVPSESFPNNTYQNLIINNRLIKLHEIQKQTANDVSFYNGTTILGR